MRSQTQYVSSTSVKNHRRLRIGAVVVCAALRFSAGPHASVADDRPVVMISGDAATPKRLEVHVGEIVSWRAVRKDRLRIELDDHPRAHEIIERHGEVRGIFRLPGEHSYIARVGDGAREARGVIVVRESLKPGSGLPDCAPESSERICFDR